MLIVKELIYKYENDDFYFDFEAKNGQITAILGKSGAGKSTLLSLIAGFLKPLKGDILVDGESIVKKEIHKRDISILFQQNNLFEHLNLYENIALGFNPKLKLTSQQIHDLNQLAKKFEIEHLLKKLPNQVSGGQKQRAALCRTILRKKSILLLDEPFSALDKELKDELLVQIKDITKDNNISTLMVTHFNEDALSVASRTLTIDRGRIVQKKDNNSL